MATQKHAPAPLKCVVERDEFLRGLAAVAGAAAGRQTIPIMECVLIAPHQAGLDLVADGGNMRSRIRIAVVSKSGGEGIAVKATRIKSAVAAFPAGAQISLDVERGGLRMACAGNRTRLAGLPAIDFPKGAELDRAGDHEAARFECESKDFIGPAKNVVQSAGTQETRHYLCGLCCQPVEGGGLAIVATDGNMLRGEHLAVELKGGPMPSVIIPTATVTSLPAASGEAMTVEATERAVRFTLGDLQITSKLIEGSYPDWRRIVPSEENYGRRAALATGDLLRAIARVEFAATGDDESSIALASTGDRLYLACADREGNSALDAVPLAAEGKRFEVLLSNRLLKPFLKTLPDDELSIMVTGDKQDPVIIRPTTAEDTIGIIMPRRGHMPDVLQEAVMNQPAPEDEN